MTNEDGRRVRCRKFPSPTALVFLGVCFICMLLVTGALCAIAEGRGDFGRWFMLVLGLWGLTISTAISLGEVL